MNIDDYKKINADCIKTIPINGQDHHLRIGGVLDFDLLSLMQDDTIDGSERMIKFLCRMICDKDGQRIFESDNKEHYEIVKKLPHDVQNELTTHVQDAVFSKKKELKEVK